MARTLGIDYGAKRIGLAVSDPLGMIARPLTTLYRKAANAWWGELKMIIAEKEVATIVVGYPLTMKGTVSKQTEEVDQFIVELESRIALPVKRYDERLSSVAARKSLVMQGIKTGHQKGAVDQTAAAIFLQDYLDSQG